MCVCVCVCEHSWIRTFVEFIHGFHWGDDLRGRDPATWNSFKSTFPRKCSTDDARMRPVPVVEDYRSRFGRRVPVHDNRKLTRESSTRKELGWWRSDPHPVHQPWEREGQSSWVVCGPVWNSSQPIDPRRNARWKWEFFSRKLQERRSSVLKRGTW